MANETITTQKINPFLWFDNNAEEAANFYTSVFKNSSIIGRSFYGEGAPLPKGTVMTIAFTLDGLKFVALNGGPNFKFTEAISFVVNCNSQEEVDHFWNKLTEGGQEVQCGWLKDKFGLSWQIVPVRMIELLTDKDEGVRNRVMEAMMKMIKIDLPALEKAAEGS